jgi:hypothetical protein
MLPEELKWRSLKSKIEMLRLENRQLMSEMQRQNEYDLSRGMAPGKFREHFTLGCVGG